MGITKEASYFLWYRIWSVISGIISMIYVYITVLMDQGHAHMSHWAVAWTFQVTYVRAILLKGLTYR